MSTSVGCSNILQGESAILLLAVAAVAALVMVCRKRTARKNSSAE